MGIELCVVSESALVLFTNNIERSELSRKVDLRFCPKRYVVCSVHVLDRGEETKLFTTQHRPCYS